MFIINTLEKLSPNIEKLLKYKKFKVLGKDCTGDCIILLDLHFTLNLIWNNTSKKLFSFLLKTPSIPFNIFFETTIKNERSSYYNIFFFQIKVMVLIIMCEKDICPP